LFITITPRWTGFSFAGTFLRHARSLYTILITFLILSGLSLPDPSWGQVVLKNAPQPPERPATGFPENSATKSKNKVIDISKDQEEASQHPIEKAGNKSDASAYEKPRHITAREILGDLVEGSNYKIRPEVGRINFSRVYTIETEYGTFEVVGDNLLKLRLYELNVLFQLTDHSQAGSFITAFGTAAIAPFKFGGQLLVSPIDTVKNSFDGVGNFFDSLEASSENEDPQRGSFIGGLVGSDPARRELASDLGVDPYTDFAPLADRLKQLSSAAGFGGLSLKGAMSAIPGAAVTQTATLATTRLAVVTASSISTTVALKDALRNKTAGQILRDARKKFSTLDISDELIKKLFTNPAYTPSDIYVMAYSLDLIKAKNSHLFIEHAILAENRNEAYFERIRSEILASWKPPSPIESFELIEGKVLNKLKGGRVVAAYPIDEYYWTEENAAISRAIAESITRADAKGRPLFVVTGDVSVRARTEIGRLGWDVVRVKLLPEASPK
jgi:hypothetical protein